MLTDFNIHWRTNELDKFSSEVLREQKNRQIEIHSLLFVTSFLNSRIKQMKEMFVKNINHVIKEIKKKLNSLKNKDAVKKNNESDNAFAIADVTTTKDQHRTSQ